MAAKKNKLVLPPNRNVAIPVEISATCILYVMGRSTRKVDLHLMTWDEMSRFRSGQEFTGIFSIEKVTSFSQLWPLERGTYFLIFVNWGQNHSTTIDYTIDYLPA